ncbi:MAG: formate dehydrogenase accessory sulfurtransferase FdhD [Gammaproteobacteria bacterium]|nr:formate dehydrogenase accessory sulfurtransferase FdhD [Gammaproteobacteria bacterium]
MSDQPGRTVRKLQRTLWQQGHSDSSDDVVAEEVAVAVMYNCISHVVMMATPADLEDFAVGFSLTEGIVPGVDDILDIEVTEDPRGLVLSIMIPEQSFAALKDQRRNMTGRTGCGLCGAETLEQAIRAPKVVGNEQRFSHTAVQTAIAAFAPTQKLMLETGAVHGAAWCDAQGNIVLTREDVGRHNALDKLIGALQREKISNSGFVLVTSRASYEMVTKVARAGIELMVAVSAPTALAIDMAADSGVALVGFGRTGRHSIYHGVERFSD